MLRLCFRQRRFYQRVRLPLPRPFSSSSNNSLDSYSNLRNPQNDPPPPAIIKPGPFITTTASPTSSSSYLSRSSVLALFATVVSAAAAASYHALPDKTERSPNPLHDALERAFFRTNESFKRVFLHARQTGAAASVLWQSLTSVLSSANHEVRVGFELRVASLLADIAAANSSRRSALVGAGGGKVVDWLLETVATDGGRDGFRTQAEAARTLAYLIADPNVSPKVLGRPHAVPYLLRFIFSCQPKKKKKHTRRSSFDVSDSLKGRSMLVAAIMDIVTANCDSIEKVSFKPSLPGCAETRDIAAAIEVIEEGGLHMDQSNDSEDDDDGGGGRGMKGIGIKILEGETALGLARTSGIVELEQADSDGVDSFSHSAKTLALLHRNDASLAQTSLSAAIVPGLWDDLHCQHVAVPFAVWALANWAMASEVNRLHIQELDQDGRAIMTALMAPERSVKWHGSLVARLLLEDCNLSLNDSVADWSSSLLTTISQASENEDVSLALVALPAFLLSVERCPEARRIVMDKGLQQMRETAKRTTKHKQVQEALAKALELLSDGDFRLSLEESQKWSGILIPWVFTRASSEKLRSSATKILSCILEGHGPASVPISQGWLAIMLHQVLGSIKGSSVKGSTQPKADKTQVDQSNIAFATQASNQLAVAVVNLALNQLGKTIDSVVTFPLTDLFNLEPFAGPFKNLKKDTIPKFDVADSAMATLKGIKALTELCSDDATCQDKLAESGVFCLLRRFLLCDDYEKLAAIKAYDASRALEAQEKPSNASDSSDADANEQLSVRVPPTAHIRKHAARLLTVLSALPKVQKIILADKLLCKWLEDCASGTIPGCTDPKLQSYARATLLNASCCHHVRGDSFSSNVPVSVVTSRRTACPYYNDMILLINPERPHWKGCENTDFDMVNKENLARAQPESGDGEGSNVGNDPSDSESDVPPLDVIFVHGLRGGPYKSWRLADDKTSTKSGLVEKIDEEAGRMGTFWPGEWLSDDFPEARLFTLKYKTNYTQWSGATLPLQEVSSKLLDKLVAAGIGNRPVVFVTHSMGGLVVKQMLHKAKAENLDNLVNNTIGVVFYSCPHFGSKLADMPLRMGLVLRPAPTIGELRSGSPRLLELNDFIRQLHKKGSLEVLSFCETKVTPIVEGYGGWAVRLEIVPIESAYPGFGELVVLESTDHINTCKPISRSDPSYKETLEFLLKLKAHYS